MRGVLLDRVSGRPEGEAAVPGLFDEIEDWLAEVERRSAINRNRLLLADAKNAPGLVGTTTTNRYLAYPAAAAGLSKASSGGAAWSFSTYADLVPVSTITSTFYIYGLTWMYPNTAAVDTTHEVLFELADGTPTLLIQIPWSYRIDSSVGHHGIPGIIFPEPKQIAANTRIQFRVAQALATTSITYNGIKLMYQMA